MNRNENGTPSWKSVMVTRRLPEELSGLETLCKNLWWCWNDNAKALFKSVDYQLWHKYGHNPMVILDKVSLKRYNELAKDKDFLARLNEVMKDFNAYMAEKANRTEPSVAYFCMEYGLDTSLKIYSGGLGILAGDYLKETSDMNVNLVAVGLFYRYGYFTQRITPQGNQVAEYEAQDFMKTPAQPVLDENGAWKTIKVALPGRDMSARIWKVAVGRTDLYLLDTDFEDNIPEDRQVTHQLYGGDWENRLKQEMLLGIGGVRALNALGIKTSIYHYNEGHAAFAGLERLRVCMKERNLSFAEAMELIRASGLFTTHTPVPAGHDFFTEDILGRYLGIFVQKLGVDWRTFMALGKINVDNPQEKFSMSFLAANMSMNVNGVSMLHGKVSQDIFAGMYPGYLPEELYISYVTNGVHYPTWAARDWKSVQGEVFGEEFKTHHYDKSCFNGIYKVSDEKVWDTRKFLKEELKQAICEKFSDPVQSALYSPSQIVAIKEELQKEVLTIGFARRFATYKRATLLFSDLDRLDAIVNNPEKPVRFIFAGKAHPADGAGQDFIKQIIEISKQDRFLGKVIFVPGYDISLAKRLVQGVDVWLNNPTRPQEASGTSGEKAAMNGVMHFSVLDGWWVEGYKEGAGWALTDKQTYTDHKYQDELDAATIYHMLENEIIPLYYDQTDDVPKKWVQYIKNSVSKIAPEFTTKRMITDYLDRFYIQQSERTLKLKANDFKAARELAAWKQQVSASWNDIEVVSVDMSDFCTENYGIGDTCNITVEIDKKNPAVELGLEVVFASGNDENSLKVVHSEPFTLSKVEGTVATYKAELSLNLPGIFKYGIRIYPSNELLPHKQDFALLKWI